MRDKWQMEIPAKFVSMPYQHSCRKIILLYFYFLTLIQVDLYEDGLSHLFFCFSFHFDVLFLFFTPPPSVDKSLGNFSTTTSQERCCKHFFIDCDIFRLLQLPLFCHRFNPSPKSHLRQECLKYATLLTQNLPFQLNLSRRRRLSLFTVFVKLSKKKD